MKAIQAGDAAPAVWMTTHKGERISLESFRGEKAVVLFFYPMDGTPICTKEACSFRDAYEDFVEAGAVVIGVSSDTAARHQAFAAQHQLQFLLVDDHDGSIRKTFGVPKTMGFMPGRVTYVIDKNGIVRRMFSSQLSAKKHVEEALECLKSPEFETVPQ